MSADSFMPAAPASEAPRPAALGSINPSASASSGPPQFSDVPAPSTSISQATGPSQISTLPMPGSAEETPEQVLERYAEYLKEASEEPPTAPVPTAIKRGRGRPRRMASEVAVKLAEEDGNNEDADFLPPGSRKPIKQLLGPTERPKTGPGSRGPRGPYKKRKKADEANSEATSHEPKKRVLNRVHAAQLNKGQDSAAAAAATATAPAAASPTIAQLASANQLQAPGNPSAPTGSPAATGTATASATPPAELHLADIDILQPMPKVGPTASCSSPLDKLRTIPAGFVNDQETVVDQETRLWLQAKAKLLKLDWETTLKFAMQSTPKNGAWLKNVEGKLMHRRRNVCDDMIRSRLASSPNISQSDRVGIVCEALGLPVLVN